MNRAIPVMIAASLAAMLLASWPMARVQAGPQAAPPTQVSSRPSTGEPQRPRPAAQPALVTMPPAHLVAAYYLHQGNGETLFADTRGKIIGHTLPTAGSKIIWLDGKPGVERRHVRLVW